MRFREVRLYGISFQQLTVFRFKAGLQKWPGFFSQSPVADKTCSHGGIRPTLADRIEIGVDFRGGQRTILQSDFVIECSETVATRAEHQRAGSGSTVLADFPGTDFLPSEVEAHHVTVIGDSHLHPLVERQGTDRTGNLQAIALSPTQIEIGREALFIEEYREIGIVPLIAVFARNEESF